MGVNFQEKVSAFSEKLKVRGTEVSRKMSAGMSTMSDRVKELFLGSNQTDKLVEEATAERLEGPDWGTNLELCDMVNLGKISSVELIRGIKKRIMRKSPRVQFLALVLLETIAKNCRMAFYEIAAERVLDEMIKLVDDPRTLFISRIKVLVLIEAWGESTDELRYLPVFEETYKRLRSRGIRFPGRDNESLAPVFTPAPSVAYSEIYAISTRHIPRDVLPVATFTAEKIQEELEMARNYTELLTIVLSSSPEEDDLEDEATVSLVEQCHQSQFTIQRMIETAGKIEGMLFNALNVNDELQKVLSKHENLKKDNKVQEDDTALMRSHGYDDEFIDDLDEMIFGKKFRDSEERQTGGGGGKKSRQDLITF